MEESTDHEILPPITIYNSQTSFHQLVVPASMRSQYWRFFGFPADESNNIITRDKIVCCICHRQIAYNKNTTNMSTHLIAKHIEIMLKYFPNDIKPSSSNAKRLKQSKAGQASQPLSKRVKSEKFESDRWSGEYSYTRNRSETATKEADKSSKTEPNSESLRVLVTTEDGEEFIETLDYDECPGIFGLDSPNLCDDEANESSRHEFLNEEYLLANANADNDVPSQPTSQDGEQDNKIFIDVYVDKSNTRSPKKSTAEAPPLATEKNTNVDKDLRGSRKVPLSGSEIAEVIKGFVVTDVLSPSILDGIGFHTLLKTISGCADILVPDSSKIAAIIEDDFSQKSSMGLREIDSLGKNGWYSLAFDKWTSENGEENTVISCSYLVSQRNNKIDVLKRQIVCILTENCTKYLSKHFKDFTKCSAAIVNWELEEKNSLRIFLEKKTIPIIQSFSSVLETTVSKCFHLAEVESTFQLLANLSDDPDQKILSSCWLVQFSRLNDLSGSTDIQLDDPSLNTVKAITECLRPLKNCLDILSEESSTWASMMKPLAHSLISEHYGVTEKDTNGGNDNDELVQSMKTIIANNLRDKITSNWFLTVASFLDPRFHGITTPEDRERIQANFAMNVKDGNVLPIKTEATASAANKMDTQKRNNLSSLFANLPVGQNSKTTKNRIETEIRSYTDDVNVDIDQCPLTWWSTSDVLYPNLRSHVQQYFSATPFVDEMHRLPLAEQTQFLEKCRKIKNEIDRKIMWLHINSSLSRNTSHFNSSKD